MTETHASSPKHDRFSASQAVAAGTDFAELRVGPAGVFWNEFRPQDGACRLWTEQDGVAVCLTPDGYSARSRVYEYGGGSFCLANDELVFVNEADQQLYRQPVTGGLPQPLSFGQKRYGGLEYAAGQVLAVEEDGDIHRLVAIDLASERHRVLAEGADFYASPVLSPDGTRLAWIEWDRPHQPWTQTRLMCSELAAVAECVASGFSLQQPRFDEQGRLYCLSDANGFWQPWAEVDGKWAPLPAASADHAAAPWQLGACTWLPAADQGYLASWFDDGFGRLGLCDGQGHCLDYSGDFTRFRALAMDADHLYAIAGSPLQPSAVIAVDRRDHSLRILAGGYSPLPAEQVSLPQPLSYPSGGEQAHGFFYAAQGDERHPPLVVFIHGGPTSACYPVFDPRIQYWTQRGFAVADLNYRGSSNHGRAYRHALHLRWGETDVQDACAVVDYLATQGRIDAQRAFVRGGSAGGYTVLCALAFAKVFRAGASLYGVSDPAALGRVTHKFENDYLDWLIGDPDSDRQRYEERTPLLHADRITAPVIFFQGELDVVVVPQQTRDMVAALQAGGVPVEAHYYDEERHGFRNAANLAHALEHEWRFYLKVMREDDRGLSDLL
ncbi:S9 family peptidase [Pseudomonas sp. CFBP 13710]|uniref:S9 family peptidase n=1 Tax=Pseudomonas sp. CFBP 13710 TaxID=2775311 RepID=UPI0017863246|nr:S9 family peptidase [Pseudomonas sp. CFBP 13710]MBD8733263.1 S9 family peptidase [Pseudomonas sp. CFBP 13710]